MVLIVSSGCGRKGPPELPESYAPGPVQFARAQGSVDAIILTWQAPKKDASGDTITEPLTFSVKRSLHVKDEEPRYQRIATIEQEVIPEDAVKVKNAPPTEYHYADKDIIPGKQYDYAIVAIGESGVAGIPPSILRVTFIGDSSVVEILPAAASVE